MGNAPSIENTGEQRRLTKPKTINHASSQSPRLDSQSEESTPRKLSDLGTDDVVWTSGGTFRSKQEAREQIRMHLFGARDAEIHDEADYSEDGEDGLGELASDVRERLTSLSQNGSVYSGMHSPPMSSTKINNTFCDSKVSLASDSRTIDIEAAIAILQELKKTASPEDLVALHRALLPTKPVEPAHDQSSKDVPMPLVRRRSLAVPGLATRGTYDLLRKQNEAPLISSSKPEGRLMTLDGPAPYDLLRRQNETPLTSSTKPEGRLLNLEELRPAPLNRLKGDRSPGPRAQTPGDMDYALLGSKLGTLMITNGAPSPAPSILARTLTNQKSLPNMHEPEDYFTAIPEKPEEPIKKTTNKGRPPTAHRRAKTFTGTPAALSGQNARSSEKPRAAAKKSRPSTPPKQQQQPGNDAMTFLDEAPTPKAASYARNNVPDAAVAAQQYISELAASPYGDNPWANDDASTYSQPSQFYDEGYGAFDDTKSFREEALNMLNGSVFADEKFLDDLAAKISLDMSSNLSTDGKLQRPTQAHTDSGYSSGASLSAVRAATNLSNEEPENPTAPAHHYFRVVATARKDAPDAKSMYSIRPMLTMPPADEVSPRQSVEETTQAKQERLPLPRTKSWKRFTFQNTPSSNLSSSVTCASDSLDSNPTQTKPVRHDSAVCTEAVEKVAHKPKKLRKKSMAASSPLIVQTNRPIRTGSVPDIPSEVSAHFTERITASPQMANLDRTFASINHSDTTLEDVPAAVSIRFPSPEPEAPKPPQHGRKWKHKRSQSDRQRSPSPPRHSLHKSRKSRDTRRESLEDMPGYFDEDQDGPTLTDFGTVASSLGGSPYDIAIPALTDKPKVTSTAHPHHLSTEFVEREPAKKMDDATAPEFLRMRSLERAALGSREPSRSRSRPSSFIESDKQSIRPVAPNFSRPHSWNNSTEDLPPTPPVKDQKYEPYRPGKTSATVTITDAERKATLAALEGHTSVEEKIPVAEEKIAVRPIPPVLMIQAPTPVPETQMRKATERSSEPSAPAGWEHTSKLWRNRRKSIGEGLKQAAKETVKISAKELPATSTTAKNKELPATPSTERPAAPRRQSTIKRYYAGLEAAASAESLTSMASAKTKETKKKEQQKDSRKSTPAASPYTLSASSSVLTLSDGPEPPAHSKRPGLANRYSGGLGYNYDSGLGIGGSAGTRDGSSKAKWKSKYYAAQYGVDLEDIPVMVQK